MQEYGLPLRENLGVWFDTHDLIKENEDLPEKSAERPYRNEVLGQSFGRKRCF